MMHKIALVRTGSPATFEQIKRLVSLLEQRYPNVIWIYDSEDLCTYRSAEARAESLLKYALTEDIDCLWVVRGGEGTADILPLLPSTLPHSKRPLHFMGFSDTTALLNYAQQYYNWQCIHGPAALQLEKDMLDTASLTLLDQGFAQGFFEQQISLTPLNTPAREVHTLNAAQSVGGNLSLVNISVKDTWELKTAGNIVFLEDWHEPPYVINRTLKYLYRVGYFENIKALVLGDLLHDGIDEDPEQKAYLDRILLGFAEQLGVPVYQTSAFGHGPENRCIIMTSASQIMRDKAQFIWTASSQST